MCVLLIDNKRWPRAADDAVGTRLENVPLLSVKSPRPGPKRWFIRILIITSDANNRSCFQIHPAAIFPSVAFHSRSFDFSLQFFIPKRLSFGNRPGGKCFDHHHHHHQLLLRFNTLAQRWVDSFRNWKKNFCHFQPNAKSGIKRNQYWANKQTRKEFPKKNVEAKWIDKIRATWSNSHRSQCYRKFNTT